MSTKFACQNSPQSIRIFSKIMTQIEEKSSATIIKRPKVIRKSNTLYKIAFFTEKYKND
jgi:hypothetical protein